MKKKGISSTVILVLIMVIGLSLLLYPAISDWWNARVSSHAVKDYIQQIADIDDDKYKEIWQQARDYNKKAAERKNQYFLSDEEKAEYSAAFNVGGTGIMAYIEIPCIDVMLPVYHGTEEPVLQVAVGHLEWTSLPTGGESTHCVLSGHRGLPSAKLFSDLDKVLVGDYFRLNVLDEVLTYEVDQIRIVLPEETSELVIEEGKDYCTLVTCTPYGVNSHRLLVRGHRIDNIEEAQEVRVTSDAMIIEKLIVVPFVFVPVLAVMFAVLLLGGKKRG
ncbi:MAG: class C sortase [Oscillospiraceae bacterium]|nr:class C sortase [Oscillospiraceae bacterium]